MKAHKLLDSNMTSFLLANPSMPQHPPATTLLNTYRTHPFHGLQEYYYRIDVEMYSPAFWLWISRVLASKPERLTIDSYNSRYRYAVVGYYARGR